MAGFAVTTEDSALHSAHGRYKAVMLFQPALLPVRHRFSGGELTGGVQNIGDSTPSTCPQSSPWGWRVRGLRA
jgi:hypothetical protein